MREGMIHQPTQQEESAREEQVCICATGKELEILLMLLDGKKSNQQALSRRSIALLLQADRREIRATLHSLASRIRIARVTSN